MKNTITKIKEYKEGVKVYYCHNCKHIFVIPKDQEEIKCYYCGDEKNNKVNYYVIN